MQRGVSGEILEKKKDNVGHNLRMKKLPKKTCSLILKGNYLAMTIVALKPDSSNTKLQINFSCRMSRYYIWMCKLRDEILNFPKFLGRLEKKKTYEIETNEPNLQPEKWKPLSPWPLLRG